MSGMIIFWIKRLFVFIRKRIIGWKKVVDIVLFEEVKSVKRSGMSVSIKLVIVWMVFVV